MSYATVNDLVERFGELEIIQLTDPDNLTGAINPAKAMAAISDGVNLIHGYLQSRYSLPLNPVPPLATRWTCDLARWFLQPHSAPDQVKANYERTLSELKEAASGVIELPAGPPEKQFSGSAELVAPARMFNPNSLKGF